VKRYSLRRIFTKGGTHTPRSPNASLTPSVSNHDPLPSRLSKSSSSAMPRKCRAIRAQRNGVGPMLDKRNILKKRSVSPLGERVRGERQTRKAVSPLFFPDFQYHPARSGEALTKLVLLHLVLCPPNLFELRREDASRRKDSGCKEDDERDGMGQTGHHACHFYIIFRGGVRLN
jgi:hypothetical protein